MFHGFKQMQKIAVTMIIS
jgi:hypothetical protein